MDQALQEFFKTGSGDGAARIDFVDRVEGKIEVVSAERQSYALKPLSEIYGSGTGGTVDPKNDAYMPLFLGIEEEIAKFDATEQRLTDGEVALALNTLGMSPEAASDVPLIRRLQSALRLILSLNNYSRTELRQAIRRVGRSVERHTESARGRAYINFIHGFFNSAGR